MLTMYWLRSRGRSGVANEVKLPRLGQGMESGTIVKWLKSEGEAVKKGEPLYELDTDKVTQEGEAPVGAVVAFIGEEGEDVTLPEPATPSAEASPATNGASAPEADAAPVAV